MFNLRDSGRSIHLPVLLQHNARPPPVRTSPRHIRRRSERLGGGNTYYNNGTRDLNDGRTKPHSPTPQLNVSRLAPILTGGPSNERHSSVSRLKRTKDRKMTVTKMPSFPSRMAVTLRALVEALDNALFHCLWDFQTQTTCQWMTKNSLNYEPAVAIFCAS